MSKDEVIWLLGVLPDTSLNCKVTQYSLQKIMIEGLGVTTRQLRIFYEPLITALNLNIRQEATLAEVRAYLNSTAFSKLTTNVSLTQLIENRDTSTNISLIKTSLYLHNIGRLT